MYTEKTCTCCGENIPSNETSKYKNKTEKILCISASNTSKDENASNVYIVRIVHIV